MTIKQKEYVPITFVAILLALIYTKNPVKFAKRLYNGDFRDVKTFVYHFKSLFDFVDIATPETTKTNRLPDEYILKISSKNIGKAANYLNKYALNISKDKVKNPDCNLPDYNKILTNFLDNIEKDTNLKDYKVYSTAHLLPILHGCSLGIIKINSIKFSLHNPIYGDIDYGEGLKDECLEVVASLNLSKFIKKLSTGKADSSIPSYTNKQKELMKLIEERVRDQELRIRTNDITEIYNIKGDKKERIHKVSQNVYRLNNRYKAIHGRKILGTKERDIPYYPILLK